MSRRRPRGSSRDLIPEDGRAWAIEIWGMREKLAREGCVWELREAASILRLPEEEVDNLVRKAAK